MSKYNGLPCKYGHGTLRYTAGRACVTCNLASSKARHASGKKKQNDNPVWRTNYNLQKKFGLSAAEYADMRLVQDCRCAICERHEAEFAVSLAVDHNHATGKVRALLRINCNSAIGKLQDNPGVISKAANYCRL